MTDRTGEDGSRPEVSAADEGEGGTETRTGARAVASRVRGLPKRMRKRARARKKARIRRHAEARKSARRAVKQEKLARAESKGKAKQDRGRAKREKQARREAQPTGPEPTEEGPGAPESPERTKAGG